MKTKISLVLIYAGQVFWIIAIWALDAISQDERQKVFRIAHQSAREADRYVASQVVATLPEISFHHLSERLWPKSERSIANELTGGTISTKGQL
jgi:hypothetical protein